MHLNLKRFISEIYSMMFVDFFFLIFFCVGAGIFFIFYFYLRQACCLVLEVAFLLTDYS